MSKPRNKQQILAPTDGNPASKTLKYPNGLTESQEMFCRHIVAGATQKDAYRAAYNTTMADNAVGVKACELRKRPKIEERIMQLIDSKQKRLAKIEHRSEDRWFRAIWREADSGDNSSARVAALREIGKAIGITKPKSEDMKRATANELAQELEDKLSELGIKISIDPDYAEDTKSPAMEEESEHGV